MNASDLLEEILAGQSADGAFRSEVQADEPVIEENCFVTALVLFELIDILPVLQTPQLKQALERGLEFINHCADTEIPGAFCFYPPHLNSPRYNGVLPPDIDDTVLAWTVNVRLGRRTVEEAAGALRRVIEPYALVSRSADQQLWVRSGASLTWFAPLMAENAVDLCVNANVLALYAISRRTEHPSYTAIAVMLDDALQQTSITTSDMAQLAPYYAHPLEIVYALRRAVQLGAKILEPTVKRVELCAWAAEDVHTNWARSRPICCYPPGYPLWVAPSLQAARQLSFFALGRSRPRKEH